MNVGLIGTALNKSGPLWFFWEFIFGEKMKTICLALISVLALFGCGRRSNDVHYTSAPANNRAESEQRRAEHEVYGDTQAKPGSKADAKTMRSCVTEDSALIAKMRVSINDENVEANKSLLDFDSKTEAASPEAQADLEKANAHIFVATEKCKAFAKAVDVDNCKIEDVKTSVHQMGVNCESVDKVAGRIAKLKVK